MSWPWKIFDDHEYCQAGDDALAAVLLQPSTQFEKKHIWAFLNEPILGNYKAIPSSLHSKELRVNVGPSLSPLSDMYSFLTIGWWPWLTSVKVTVERCGVNLPTLYLDVDMPLPSEATPTHHWRIPESTSHQRAVCWRIIALHLPKMCAQHLYYPPQQCHASLESESCAWPW